MEVVSSFVDFFEARLYERLNFLNPKPIGLPTGRTMEPIYEELVVRLQCWPQSDFDRLRLGWNSFNLDEYLGLGIDHSQSFHSYMAHYLGQPLSLKQSQMHVPNGLSINPEIEAQSYVRALNKAGGIGIQVLGLGANGHVGFNEPPCGPWETCRVVSLSNSTRKQNAFAFENDLKKVPSKAITLGLKDILRADEIHLVVFGSDKADILFKLLNTRPQDSLPASWLRTHNRVFLWADEDALSAENFL
ncbi:glucosamine-6-phosphate deaminase [Prochlorococcus sp. MIT 1300]|uniref:glucosamine-6-phosphate deaminase n=1 Tax=Prochlorococcus sp. MIT 1300 TaxID=3096218 RepID=UPI002A7505A4|nr:glucosamine-6-phosphate deaminase [Prochlorococcus sp. MIT 1300]